jgi:starvation-inducible DNA-binding protein
MNDLLKQLKVVLASTFSYYLKAHAFHWNVEGPDFPQYHGLFETIYTDAFDAVDSIAERIRTLNSYAPGSLNRYLELSVIEDQINIPQAKLMIVELIKDNNILIEELNKAYKLAESANKMGLSNFIQDRLDKHEKLGWMMKATSK